MSDLRALFRRIIVGFLLGAGMFAPSGQAAFSGPSLGSSAATPPASPEKTLAFGFDVINSVSLKEVVIGESVIDGIRGLSTLDPEISLLRSAPRRIALRYGSQPIGNYATPPLEGNITDWASLVMTMAHDASGFSPKLARADGETIVQAVFDASLAKLDKFSRYAGPVEAEDHQATRNGFGGIGVRYESHPEDIILTEVMPDTPAAAKGLQVGDHILHVDGTPVGGLDVDHIARLMRGTVGSPVTLTLRRRDAPQTASLVLNRALIVPPTVSLSLQDGIATIAISSFNATTARQATDAVVKAKASAGFKGVILDLRGDPGGLLDQGVAVADLFLDHGRIVSTKGRHPATLQSYDARLGDPGETLPLVVLVDGKSASASEIVAAALEDSGRAVIVGTNSYGKGTVQKVIDLPNHGEMTLTWSRYYTPSGYALHGLGVLPTICTADSHATPAALLSAALEGRTGVVADMVGWRLSGVDEEARRTLLRSHCPAAKHADNNTDPEVARSLLNNSALYRRALALTAPASSLAAVLSQH